MFLRDGNDVSSDLILSGFSRNFVEFPKKCLISTAVVISVAEITKPSTKMIDVWCNLLEFL